MTSFDLQAILPELLLATYAMLALVAVVYTGKDKLTPLVTWVTAAVMVALAVLVGTRASVSGDAFGGLLSNDAFARFGQVGVLLAGSSDAELEVLAGRRVARAVRVVGGLVGVLDE